MGTEGDLGRLPPQIKRSQRSRVSEGLPARRACGARAALLRRRTRVPSGRQRPGCHRTASERLGEEDAGPPAAGIASRLAAQRPDRTESKWRLPGDADTGGTAATAAATAATAATGARRAGAGRRGISEHARGPQAHWASEGAGLRAAEAGLREQWAGSARRVGGVAGSAASG